MAVARSAAVAFTGTRLQMLGLLLRGYLLTLATIGIYRFWLVTQKRRFYWKNTEIDGDPLEYTGTALQLLIGFLIAVAIFLPLYLLFFYLSTQSVQVALIGYAAVGALIYVLGGYALYRARRFRLTRTLWRGVRFGQSGNAWAYALRRMLRSLLVVGTAGLAYPFMASGLARYRYARTWFGDRQFSFTGNWKTIAAPYYLGWTLIVLLGAAASWSVYAFIVELGPEPHDEAQRAALSLRIVLAAAGFSALAYIVWTFYRAAEASRILSSLAAGGARLKVRVRGWTLLFQTTAYAVGLAIVGALFASLIALTLAGMLAAAPPGVVAQLDSPAQFTRLGIANLAILAGLYLGLIGGMALLAEVILGLGYWKAVARGASITGADSLKTVRAKGEESTLAGEGLADALNVGSY